MKNYDIAMIEKPFEDGLTRTDIQVLLDWINGEEVYPIEICAEDHECSAMGFITADAADQLDFDYEMSGLEAFVANILDDMNNESEDCSYEFKGLKIWLSR